MAHFWDGQGQHGRSSGKRRGSRRRGGATLGRTNPCQEAKSHQHQCDVSVPPEEAPNFVMIQPQIFGVCDILFNMPPGSTGLHHLLQGGSRWSEHQVIPLLVGIRDAAADEEPMASIIFPAM